ncbi:hypothetical protein [Synechococcus sp. A15-127]|uniref:hypothetical protein n=1 Tax=Synechococcus sp. A15-127 TaxID=1050624 RepID=UPI0016477F78|nr:hypothetical protein [Synechococcus sp. A15-127]
MPKPKPFSMNSRSTTLHNHLLGLIAVSLLLLVASAAPANAMSECEFIIRTMNKLGSRMSVLRMTIASTDDKGEQDLASQQLDQYNADYRLAKKQFSKANCGDTWSRD